MDIYYYIPIALIILHFLSLILGERIKKLLFIFTSVIFFIIIGFREVGFDYDMYQLLYQAFSGDDWYAQSNYYSTEVGYALVNHLSPSFDMLLLTISGIIITTQFTFIYRNTKYPFLALFFYYGMFFYTSLMGQYRQAFALGLMLLAITHIENKKKFFFFIFIAFSFHYTAILTIILLFIPKKILSLQIYIYTLIGSILLAIIFPLIFSNIVSFASYLEAKSSFYEKADYEEIKGINSVMMIRIFLFSLLFYFRKKLTNIPNMAYYINIYFVSLLVYIGFSFMTALASRGSIYFAYFEFILAANLIYVLRRHFIMYSVLTLIFISLSISRQLKSFDEDNFKECFVPYKNWLIKEL